MILLFRKKAKPHDFFMLHVWQKSRIKGIFQTSVVSGQVCEDQDGILISVRAPGSKDHYSLSKETSYSACLPGECKGLRAFGVCTFNSSVQGVVLLFHPWFFYLGFPLWTSARGVYPCPLKVLENKQVSGTSPEDWEQKTLQTQRQIDTYIQTGYFLWLW